MTIFWSLVILSVAFWLFSRSRSRQKNPNTVKSQQLESTSKQVISINSAIERIDSVLKKTQSEFRQDLADDAVYVETDWNTQFSEIDKAIADKNYDFARQWLQRFAHTITGNDAVPQLVKDRFKKVMTEFASYDPLYKQIIARVLPMVHASPGLMQSQIYKGQSDEIKEQMRYALYFAHELGHIRRLKKGNSYQLFLPEVKEMYGNHFTEVARENGVVTYETSPKYVGGIGASMTVTIDEETAALKREATKLKDIGDWDGAIAALKKARDRTGSDDLRLPVFLQQAGKFDEAIAEFNRMLSGADEQYAIEFSHQPEFIQRGQALHAKAAIYDKMRLACKRQKLSDEANRYATLCEEYREQFDAYREVADEYQLKKQKEWLQSKVSRSK